MQDALLYFFRFLCFLAGISLTLNVESVWISRMMAIEVYLLSKESRNKVFNHSDVNSSLKAFMDIFLFRFETANPYKRLNLRKTRINRWLSKGLINSRKIMGILNNLKED